jgi:hypothetical protein
VDRQPLFSQQFFTANLETQLNRFARDIYAPTVTECCSRAGSALQSWPETPVRTRGSDEIPERTEHRSWSIAGFAVEISFWIALDRTGKKGTIVATTVRSAMQDRITPRSSFAFTCWQRAQKATTTRGTQARNETVRIRLPSKELLETVLR